MEKPPIFAFTLHFFRVNFSKKVKHDFSREKRVPFFKNMKNGVFCIYPSHFGLKCEVTFFDFFKSKIHFFHFLKKGSFFAFTLHFFEKTVIFDVFSEITSRLTCEIVKMTKIVEIVKNPLTACSF